MVRGRFRSRTFRRVKIKTPGGRNIVHFRRRNPAKAQCGSCGSELKAVPRLLPYEIRNTPKTKRRPERPYGGVLCSKCTRELIKSKLE